MYGKYEQGQEKQLTSMNPTEFIFITRQTSELVNEDDEAPLKNSSSLNV